MSRLLLLILVLSLPSAGLARFRKLALEVPGQIIAVEPADLDGDELGDLVVSFSRGEGASTRRLIGVFFGRPTGFEPRPDVLVPAPKEAILFGLGEVTGARGVDVVYLYRYGVFAQSIDRAGAKPVQRVALRPPSTFALVPDPEALSFWPLVVAKPRFPVTLVVPGDDVLMLYRKTPDGTFGRWAEPRVGIESSYAWGASTERQGGDQFSLRSSTEIAELSFTDQSGDDVVDLVAHRGDRVSVFLGNASGTLSSTPAIQRDFRLRTRQEETGREASIELAVEDLDGDGVADVAATRLAGGLSNAKTATLLFRGKRGGGFEAAPLQSFEESGYSASLGIVDVDGDGRVELIRPFAEISIVAITRVLIGSELILDLRIFRRDGKGLFEGRPAQVLEARYALDFAKGSAFSGAEPIFGADFDGDGKLDALVPDGKEKLQLFRGNGPNSEELFEDEPSYTLSAPSSRLTKALPIRGSRSGVVVAYLNRPELQGKLFTFDWVDE